MPLPFRLGGRALLVAEFLRMYAASPSPQAGIPPTLAAASVYGWDVDRS